MQALCHHKFFAKHNVVLPVSYVYIAATSRRYGRQGSQHSCRNLSTSSADIAEDPGSTGQAAEDPGSIDQAQVEHEQPEYHTIIKDSERGTGK